jgi:hypothetical protein
VKTHNAEQRKIKKQLWQYLILANLLGLLAFGVHWYIGLQDKLSISAFVSAELLLFVTGSLASAPLIRFVVLDWDTRYLEFLNRLNSDALTAYLQQFWEKRTMDDHSFIAWRLEECSDKATTQAQIDRSMDAIFEDLYHEQYGRSAFFMPMALLFFSIFISTIFSILAYLHQTTIAIEDTDVTVIAIASIAGAYMYIVSDSIQNVRQRSLNSSTIYWYTLRMILAIPIGVALTSLIAQDAQPFVAFGLGALPMDQIIKGLRHLSTEKLNLTVADEESDQLIKLEGVTARISSLLIAEGVDSIDQIINVDPVLLSIRTGLAFKFILHLGSQAIVRRHLGETTEKLIPLGLANARSIADLVDDLDDKNGVDAKSRAEAVLAAATASVMSASNNDPAVVTSDYSSACLEHNFRQIANNNYTKFIQGKLLKLS